MISSYAKNPTAWILSSRYQERTSIRGNHVRTIDGTTFVTLFDYFTALRTPSKACAEELKDGFLKISDAIVKATMKADPHTRNAILATPFLLLDSAQDTLP